MAEGKTSARQLAETMRRIVDEVEDLWIEKEVCRRFVTQYAIAAPELVEQAIQVSLKDEGMRREARERFRAMREAVEQHGMAAYLEETSEGLPPSGKPH
jgi:predicted DNA-binding protein